MDGAPCIRRLRIPVAPVVGMAAQGMTMRDILAASSFNSRRHSTAHLPPPPAATTSNGIAGKTPRGMR